MKLNDLPLNQVIEFKLTSDVLPIPENGRDQIVKLLYGVHTKDNGVYSGFDFADLATAIDWKWMGERGTLPKRLESYMYKKYNIKLKDDVTSDIGNLARKDIPKEQIYYFDISTDFSWKAGDFGDHGSCFFDRTPDRGESRPGYQIEQMKKDNRMRAIRFFKPLGRYVILPDINKFYSTDNSAYIGVSRAWFILDTQKSSKSQYGIVFNGYGIRTSNIAKILSSYLDLPFKQIELRSNIYVNEGGYLLADANVSKNIGRYDLRLAEYF